MASQDQQIVYQVPFTQIPNWIFGKLAPPELAVLCVLLSFGTTKVFPSHSTIASMAMISKSGVQRALAGLVEKQIIRWTCRRKTNGSLSSNLYEVLVWELAGRDPMVKLNIPYGQGEHTLWSDRLDPMVRVTEPYGQGDRVTRLTEQDLLNKTQLTNKEGAPPQSPKKNKRVEKKDELIQKWIEQAPIEFSGYLEPVKAWLEQRWESHSSTGRKDPWGIHQRSAKALRYAISKKVADEFLEQAAERGWLSLGFSNYALKIDQIGKPQGQAFRADPLDNPRSTKKEICMEYRPSAAPDDSGPIPMAIADLTLEIATSGQFFFAGETPATQEAKQIITALRAQSKSNGVNQ